MPVSTESFAKLSDRSGNVKPCALLAHLPAPIHLQSGCERPPVKTDRRPGDLERSIGLLKLTCQACLLGKLTCWACLSGDTPADTRALALAPLFDFLKSPCRTGSGCVR